MLYRLCLQDAQYVALSCKKAVSCLLPEGLKACDNTNITSHALSFKTSFQASKRAWNFSHGRSGSVYCGGTATHALNTAGDQRVVHRLYDSESPWQSASVILPHRMVRPSGMHQVFSPPTSSRIYPIGNTADTNFIKPPILHLQASIPSLIHLRKPSGQIMSIPSSYAGYGSDAEQGQ